MKIIEAMKQIKNLQRKAEDIRKLIGTYHVGLDIETPAYGSADKQAETVSGWLQSHSDIVKEISRLRFGIQKTNVVTNVAVELGGKKVTKTIAEWIHRRKDLSKMDLSCWSMLNDRSIQPTSAFKQTDGTIKEVKLVRFYDIKERDAKKEVYASEPLLIDAALEMVNAITDIAE